MYIYPSIVFLRKKKNIFFATKAKRRKKNIINLIHYIITLISQKSFFFKYKSISHQIIEKKDKEGWKEFAQHNLLHSTIIWKIIEKEIIVLWFLNDEWAMEDYDKGNQKWIKRSVIVIRVTASH